MNKMPVIIIALLCTPLFYIWSHTFQDLQSHYLILAIGLTNLTALQWPLYGSCSEDKLEIS